MPPSLTPDSLSVRSAFRRFISTGESLGPLKTEGQSESASHSSVRVDGKFFAFGNEPYRVRALSYGPVRPHSEGGFASPRETARDFELIRRTKANTIRVYLTPPSWFLDLASDHNLRVWVDAPWRPHTCFLGSREDERFARDAVIQCAKACVGHPAVFAINVVNEIPPDVARWHGSARLGVFLDELVSSVKSIDPDRLCSFANYPPTEYLHSDLADFNSYNVYLHDPLAFRRYLARLQMIADSKPLVISEIGVDSLRESESFQANHLARTISESFEGGAAGVCVYSYTDEWYRGDAPVLDWAMGLTTTDRTAKPAFAAVEAAFGDPVVTLPSRVLKVSIVVACYNGAKLLRKCLESLQELAYPDYEVLVVDDGSTDETARIASLFPAVRLIVHDRNLGLSAARNSGIAAAEGDLVAFTDADCRADRYWLTYLVSTMIRGNYEGIGGHNLLPPDDSLVGAAVMASPGGPAHVMLTDELAEHIPGCNMMFWRNVLLGIGCFDPIYRKAGDDVDLCWRLQQKGYRIGFSPAGFVWHYRRSTIGDYLNQQKGYGEAEALLLFKHPEKFNWTGGGLWRGRIYSQGLGAITLQKPAIYHGTFGKAMFQSIYTPRGSEVISFFSTLEYFGLFLLPLFCLSLFFKPIWLLFGLGALVPLSLAYRAGKEARLPLGKKRFWSRPLVSLLYLLQPIVRGWARYKGQFTSQAGSKGLRPGLAAASKEFQSPKRDLSFRVSGPIDRADLLGKVMASLESLGCRYRTDSGWDGFDMEILLSRWSRVVVMTAEEDHGHGKRIVRCRIESRPSFAARFSLLALSSLGVLVAFTSFSWWGGLAVVSLPVIWGLLQRDQRSIRHLIEAVIEQEAKDLGLEPIQDSQA